MRTTDDLVRTLQRQAAETAAWPAPVLRTPRRRHRLRTAGLVLATVAAVVVAVAVVPRLLATPQQQTPPSAVKKLAESPGPQDWDVVRCADVTAGGCSRPAEIDFDGRRLTALAGGLKRLHEGRDVVGRFTYDRDRVTGDRWLLVGALGSGPRSRLEVRTTADGVRRIAPGRLSLVRVTHDPSGDDVVEVREAATPLPRETLVVTEYQIVP